MWCICTHNGILFSHKKKDILSLATMWMNLEDIMLSGVSQAQKGKYCIALYVESKRVKLTEMEHRTVVAKSWGVGEMGR